MLLKVLLYGLLWGLLVKSCQTMLPGSSTELCLSWVAEEFNRTNYLQIFVMIGENEIILLCILFKLVTTNWPILINCCNSVSVSKSFVINVDVRNLSGLSLNMPRVKLHLSIRKFSI